MLVRCPISRRGAATKMGFCARSPSCLFPSRSPCGNTTSSEVARRAAQDEELALVHAINDVVLQGASCFWLLLQLQVWAGLSVASAHEGATNQHPRVTSLKLGYGLEDTESPNELSFHATGTSSAGLPAELLSYSHRRTRRCNRARACSTQRMWKPHGSCFV